MSTQPVHYGPHDEPIISMPELTLPALRAAVATISPSDLPVFKRERDEVFMHAAIEGAAPVQMFLRRWAVFVAIERRPDVSARFHAAERVIRESLDAQRWQTAAEEVAAIRQAAHLEVDHG
jgi:hypothetical protein